jgi:topoisomerase-4 subunit A
VVVDSPRRSAAAYETGKGAIGCAGGSTAAESGSGKNRDRKGRAGTWHLVITEIPYQVQKGQADRADRQLIADKKLPILEDIRDESDEQIRIVLCPRAATSIPTCSWRSLFRLTDLETRFQPQPQRARCQPHAAGHGAEVLLQQWVNRTRSTSCCAAPSTGWTRSPRLELLDGYIIAYLNLDRIIEIIRTEDEPKPVMMAEFSLTDRQAEAILNMRLRSFAQAGGNGAAPRARACWPNAES